MPDAIIKDYSKKSVVTKSFRNIVLSLYPGLNQEESYRRLFAILLFSVHRDKDSSEVIIPYGVLADIEDMENDYLNNNYNALPFLKRFQSDVMSEETFTWSGWRKDYKKARTARVVWKDELIEALKSEIPNRRNKNVKKVIFSTGENYSATKRKLEYVKRREESLQIIAETEPAAKKLLKYLDGRSQRIYTTKFYENVDEVVSQIENDTNHSRADYNIRVLKSIERIPKPIYSPSKKGKTDRIFTGSWMLLSREYRNILTKGWDSYDLKYSQVAICAALWHIRVINDFLTARGNVWEELFIHLGLNYSLKQTNKVLYDELKDPLKDALYSIVFGKRVCDVENELDRNELLSQSCSGPPSTFTQNFIIKNLISAREKQKTLIKKAGCVATCFGRTVDVEYLSPRKNNIKSIMALEAQALELKILLPVVSLAKTTNDFQIVLWAHDGFYIWYKDAQKKQIWEPRIIASVKREINRHKIITELE